MKLLIFIFLCCSIVLQSCGQQTKQVQVSTTLPSDFEKAYHYKMEGNKKDDLGDKQGAIDAYTKAIEIYADYDTAYYNRAIIKDDVGDFKGAIADCNKAIEINPKYFKVYYNRGVIKENLGDFKGAIADYSKTIEINPKYSKAYYNRGTIKFNSGKYEDAIDDFTRAIEENSNYVSAYYNRGVSYSELGKNDNALADYKKALEVSAKPLDSTAADMYSNIGRIYYDKEQFKDAINCYDQGIAVAPNDGDLY